MGDLDRLIGILSREEGALSLVPLSDEGAKAWHARIKPQTREGDSLPLSYSQERIWFLGQLGPGGAADHISVGFRLCGPLDVGALEKSLNEIIRRHRVLRTTFTQANGQLAQLIRPSTPSDIPEVDLRRFAGAELDAEIRRQAANEAQQLLDLTEGPLLRVKLLRIGDDGHVLLLTMHRIVADDWSLGVLCRELGVLYGAFCAGKPSPLPELPIQLADYALWQRRWLQGEVLASQREYWMQQLGSEQPVAQLPTDRPRPQVRTERDARQSVVLPEALVRALEALGQQESAALSMTLLTAYLVLLCRYSGQEDLIVGWTVPGRDLAGIEGLIGPFANTLVLRSDVSGSPSFRELMGRVREVVSGAYVHRGMPFEKLVEELQPERDMGRPPLCQVGYRMLSSASGELALPGLTVEPLAVSGTRSELDLTLQVRQQGEHVELELVYRADLFDPDRMVEMLHQLKHLLTQVVAHPERAIRSYSLVTPGSRTLLPDPRTALPEPWHEPITVLFASWRHCTAGDPAVQYGDRTWTYGDVGRSGHSVAQVLLAQGVERGDVVAVCGARSFGLIASMVGVLLGGGVLLNLDRSLPRRRQEVMLQEAGARCLLYIGLSRPADRWMWDALTVICVDPDSGRPNHIDDQIRPAELALPQVSPEDAAYLFFTSGTTGVPKGVLGCHRGLSHFLSWQRQTFGIGPGDRSAQLTGLSFDVVLRDVFTPLTSGATLCLPAEEVRLEPARLLSWMEHERISMLHTVPSLAQSWLANVPPGVSLRALRWVFFAGEPLSETLVRRWRDAFPEAGEIVNLYGPTETTMAKCYFCVPADPLPGVQPVGSPLPETQALVLAQNHQLCGIGEPGEIVIRTPFRSLGYINASEENQRRFVKNPFRHDERDLLYHTGDRGRYRPDGTLDILGRVDHQVKLRGVRIELGGIETVLGQHPAVWQTVVVVREDLPGDQRLVAYLTTKQGATLATHELRRFLKQRLPDPMVPSAFVLLDALPLTPNGKVDRRALPLPEGLRPELEAAYMAPRTELERTIAAVWQDVLRLEQAGIHDSFFDLGGHSLLLIQVQVKLREALGRDIPVVELFEYPTVGSLAEHLSQEQNERSFGQQVRDRTRVRRELMKQRRQSRSRA